MKITRPDAAESFRPCLSKTFIVIVVTAALSLLLALQVNAQGSRKDDIVFGPSGHPVAGATVAVCQPSATGTPCSPLAVVYTDATLTVPAANPMQTDGIGNYHFYAPAGRYMVQISGPGITGTLTYPDVILPADVSSTGSGNNISAFGLTLGGNLSVAGNATIGGTLTTSNFSPTTLSPSSLNVTGNETIKGPRPWVDVTAFGADASGVTDSTAAIQNAITAACTSPFSHNATTPGVIFPPGNYKVTQTQTPSSNPIFTLCAGLHLLGMGGQYSFGQFFSSPQAVINVATGSSPNNAAAVAIPSSAAGAAIQNLAISGYNQAVYDNAVMTHLINDMFGTRTTGSQDNAGLEIADAIWVWVEGGSTQTSSGSVPGIEIVNDNVADTTGLIRISDMVSVGGGVVFINRATPVGGGFGNVTFRNDLLENCGGPFFSVTTVGSNVVNASEIHFENTSEADCGNYPLMIFNVPGGSLDDVYVSQSPAGSGNCTIEMISGTLRGVFAPGEVGTAIACDGSGTRVGNVVAQTGGGLDYVADTSVASRLDSVSQTFVGPPLRATSQGNSFASLALDPSQGLLFNDGANYGYDAGIYQPALGDLDVEFASAFPPTGLVGTPTTGGSLAAGTYYYAVVPCVISPCGGPFGTSSQPSAAVVVSGAKNAVQLTWTDPPTGASTITGYLVYRGTNPSGLDQALQEATPNVYVPGGTSTSYTDNGFNGGYYGPLGAMPHYQSVHRFTATSLGINTTNPQFNLDVNGSAAVNSLNGVAKAERFSGVDAAAQINACLSAAQAASTVCDARGLTGTLTGAHHITIPAGTVLLWGRAQLTIDDTTTKDAVELTGDGASIRGYEESGVNTLPNTDAAGYIACGVPGCTAVQNPGKATGKINFVHIEGMYLLANGASSKVIDMTSIGHSTIENNSIVLGTGGNSYGIFGDTSTGNQDSTNTKFYHNNIEPQGAGDTCLSLAGVFNAVVIEQNTCILPHVASTVIGFQFEKDSNGNYPNNDEVYGNDCESANPSVGQICYNVVGAKSVTFGPNNRCEKVYTCLQPPSDGSATGIHFVDTYLSLSNMIQLSPNEPAASMIAVDNASENWLPSMHYGFSDIAGPNLLGNAGFEGWQNSTTLDYWGGVSGVNINQAGSGIYAQNSSSSSAPAVDSFTQGSYNVRVGDGATAGLGINSGCVPVDATQNYTLAFRVADPAGINFRPGFRFYNDANCTEADKITNVATNARVLAPANYAGMDFLIGATNANWQSTNASLTYNNGITCNCNVTGADWQVGAANTWYPTRNFAITFRVPNAGYSSFSSATVAHSMRVFLLENSASASNYVYFDDVILSQGPVSANVRFAPLNDSGNGGTVNGYGSYNFAGTLSLQSNTPNMGTFSHSITANRAWTLPDTSGTVVIQTGSAPSNGDCAQFSVSGGTVSVGDSGAACAAAPYTSYAMGFLSSGQAPSSANAVDVSTIYLPNVQFSHITVDVSTTDANTGDFYSWAITDTSGNVKCSIAAINLTAGGASDASCTQGTVTLLPGKYIFAFTGNATTAKIGYSGTAPLTLSSAVSSSTSSGGTMTFPISIPAAGVTYSSYGLPALILH